MEDYKQYLGKTLDSRYQLVKLIGEGGMAVVFEAADLATSSTVALKLLKEEEAEDVMTVKRFINESRAIAALSHPNIVQVFDVGVRDEAKYIVMERLHGITLKDYLQKKGTLTLREILSYSEQILLALSQAHARGIVHRDIKPQNVMLLKNGAVKVMDFGIAALPSSEDLAGEGSAIGTASYMSPEQAKGQSVDCRSDLYSLGVCMYEMATGTLPFYADSPASVARMQVSESPRRPRDILPGLPLGLEQIILGAMEKDPNRRFQDAKSMLHHIGQLRSDPDFVFKTKKVRHIEQRDEETGEKVLVTTRVLDTNAVREKPMKKKKQSTSMFPIIFGAALAFLLVAIVCGYVLIASYLQREDRNAPVVVQVPTFVGKVASEEYLRGFDPALFAFEIEYVSDDSYAAGTVIAQEPEAGMTRKVQKASGQKCTVTLTVSRPEGVIPLPDVTYREHREVEQALKSLGFKVTEVKEYNDSVESGYVIRTQPKWGSELKAGASVTIYVSRGAQVERITVPNFVGNSAHYAYERMQGHEAEPLFVLGKVDYAYSSEVPEGCVAAQSVEAYSTVPRGTEISFTVSLGVDPAETTPAETGEETGEETGGETEPETNEETGEPVDPAYLF